MRLRTIISATAILALGLLSYAYQRTTRPRLKTQRVNADCVKADTLSLPSDSILHLSGYDKPLRSSRESLFVTNRTCRTIKEISFDVEYLDRHGRQLHKRRVTVRCDIPSGQTRRVEFPSWDTQHAFYYRLSTKPQRADGAPYDIRCTVNYCLTSELPSE